MSALVDRARRLFQRFHWGREPAARQRRLHGPAGVPPVTVQLGELVELEVRPLLARTRLQVTPSRPTVLATDAAGRRLYLLATREPLRDGPTGHIAAVIYRSDKGDGARLYRHAFEAPRPVLTTNRAGEVVVRRAGSRFRVTARGIEG